MGRSHGDVNSDSLLVHPERCRITKKHWKEWTTHPAVPSIHPSNLSPCTTAAQSVKSNKLVWSTCIHEDCQCACGLTLCHGKAFKGRQRGREGTRDPSELLRAIIWWLMVGGCQARHDKLWQARIALSHCFAVYLSAFLCPTTPSLTYPHPSISSVLVLVSSQTNFWGNMPSKVL